MGKVFADDTPIPVLDPGRGRTKTGRLWVYTRDDRPWGGPDPPAALYFYSPDRKAERRHCISTGLGILQVDGYVGFERLAASGDIVLAACWGARFEGSFTTSMRRPARLSRPRPYIRIAALYAVEKSIRGRPAARSARPRVMRILALSSRR